MAVSQQCSCVYTVQRMEWEGEHIEHHYLRLLAWLRTSDPSCLEIVCVYVCVCVCGAGIGEEYI